MKSVLSLPFTFTDKSKESGIKARPSPGKHKAGKTNNQDHPLDLSSLGNQLPFCGTFCCWVLLPACPPSFLPNYLPTYLPTFAGLLACFPSFFFLLTARCFRGNHPGSKGRVVGRASGQASSRHTGCLFFKKCCLDVKLNLNLSDNFDASS